MGSTTRSRGASVPSMLATTRARGRSAKFSAAPPPPLRKPRQMLWGSGTCSISSTTATCPPTCNKVLFTYITSLLRSVRFGTDSSQGLAAAVQLNQYLEENAIIQLDQKAGKDQGKFQVNFKKLENSVKDRVKEYVTMQHSGGKEAVEKLLAKYGVVSERMRSTLANVEDVPVDIRPIFQMDY